MKCRGRCFKRIVNKMTLKSKAASDKGMAPKFCRRVICKPKRLATSNKVAKIGLTQ